MMKCFIEENVDFALIFTKLDKCNQKDRSKNQKLFQEELDKNSIKYEEIYNALQKTRRISWFFQKNPVFYLYT